MLTDMELVQMHKPPWCQASTLSAFRDSKVRPAFAFRLTDQLIYHELTGQSLLLHLGPQSCQATSWADNAMG
jgi:hypothetical protein